MTCYVRMSVPTRDSVRWSLACGECDTIFEGVGDTESAAKEWERLHKCARCRVLPAVRQADLNAAAGAHWLGRLGLSVALLWRMYT